MIEKTCEYCGKSFLVKNGRKDTAHFCSYSCRSKKNMGIGVFARFWRGGDVTFSCIVCGKETIRKRGITGGTYKFCSDKCHNDFRKKRVSVKCENCGIEFELVKSRFDRGSRFCSRKCSKEFMTKENSPLWKGGERGRKFYPKQWNNKFRNEIRERDNYTCKICGEYGDSVHHINYVKMDTTPENCVTLCRSCHAKTNSNRDYWIKYFSSC